tara:strand:- start:115 stop:411 length:297 start_codon:yes stop_codon:yes gene_type:complete
MVHQVILESLSKSLSIDARGEAFLKGWLKDRMTSMDEMRDEEDNSEAETQAEIIYWATGRTKIYPEKNFGMRYAKIKVRSEQKRKEKNEDKANVGLTE